MNLSLNKKDFLRYKSLSQRPRVCHPWVGEAVLVEPIQALA